MKLEILKPAPTFVLESDEGEISLSDLTGQNVVLYFYPKDDTPGCTIEAQDFTKRIKDFEKQNCVVLGISKDTVKSHCKFVEKYNLAFNLLSDIEGEVCEKYGVLKEKSMFGKKYFGIERSTFLIDKYGNIANIWRSVKVNGHVEEVLKTLSKLEK
ncbi:MAG: thioredoxin-dependent thiol peroxidase [Pelagibacterales bacterium]|nr:thioredoxin-dependent thiol peroxidase [Pelagibacterales bacterium]